MTRAGLAAVGSAAPAPAQPLRARLSASPVALKVAGGVLILASWEAIVRATAPAYVAKPSGIVAALPRVVTNPAVLSAAGITLTAVVEGLVLAVVFGTLVGLATGSIRIAERALGIYVNGLYAMPMVAIVPLLTIWFGYTSAARLATIVFASFFPVAMNVCDGARSVPPEYLEVARAFRARPRHIWLGITLPSSLPYVLAGIRLAVGRALVGAVVAEFVISIDGLGFYILFQSRTFHHNEALVAVLLLAFFAVLVDAGIDWLVRARLPWYRPGEKAA
jgi:ABC-type nitrate/sulfonate/bicarbonate transport system permease component